MKSRGNYGIWDFRYYDDFDWFMFGSWFFLVVAAIVAVVVVIAWNGNDWLATLWK